MGFGGHVHTGIASASGYGHGRSIAGTALSVGALVAGQRSGFTILEMLVVIAIILALAGMSYPVMTTLRARADVRATSQLVQAVAGKIQDLHISAVTGSDGNIYHAWAMGTVAPLAGDTDQLADQAMIDGDPRLYAAGTTLAARAKPSYTGFIDMSGIPLGTGQVNAKRQVVDRWRRPLHIAYAAHVYGAAEFGVWSSGRNMNLGGPIDSDDLCSWNNTDE